MTTAPVFSLAARMGRMNTSAVREILKVAERPDVLSFAGGLPAPELFPVQALNEAFQSVLGSAGGEALQYSTTEGYLPLREWIAARLQKQGIDARAECVLITNGAQQGIDLVARVLLDRGDRVAVENPSYVAALQTFGGYEAEFVRVGSDADGLRVDELSSLPSSKLLYVVPDFHNPTGATLAVERRHQLASWAHHSQTLILEDDPYGELRFEGQPLPKVAAIAGRDHVVYLGTFSKTLAPGLRIGWLLAPPSLMKAVTIAKQASDLHSGTLGQRAAARLLETFDYEGHLEIIRHAYRARRDMMIESLMRHLPDCQWTQPNGGLFLWVTLPEGVSADALFQRAIEQKVAVVPGSAFFPTRGPSPYVRLNFSNRPPELIEEGIARLGKAVRGMQAGGILTPLSA